MKKLITILIILNAVIWFAVPKKSVKLGADDKLTEKALIKTYGEAYYHYFKDKDGNIHKIPTTREDYEKYSATGKPEYKDMEWMYSEGGPDTYTTSTPALSDNEYVVIDDVKGEYLIKEPDKAPQIVDKDYLTSYDKALKK